MAIALYFLPPYNSPSWWRKMKMIQSGQTYFTRKI
jgi:hypothetical protein